MLRLLAIAAIALLVVTMPVMAAGITGQYVECRTCDVWTGPCFANAEMNLTGKHAILGWKVEKGTLDNVRLDGLSIVAVVAASDTLGLDQTGPARAVLIVDKDANPAQKEALIRLAQKQAGDLVKNVVTVQAAPINLELCPCKDNGCARLKAAGACVETRCLDAHHDKKCGNESAYYPPLAKNLKVKPAVATESGYTGKGFNKTWIESERRGAYVGTFEIQ
jgi:hypothetical protein